MKKCLVIFWFLQILFVWAGEHSQKEYAPGQLIAKGNIVLIEKFLQEEHITITNALTIDNNIYQIILENKTEDIFAIIAKLQKQSFVAFAQVNWILSLHEKSS